MMPIAELVEGVGDEVIWAVVAVVVIGIISLAWISTGIPPIDYYVWLVQMHIYPNRNVVQVLHMDHEDATVLENQLVQRRESNRNESQESPNAGSSSQPLGTDSSQAAHVDFVDRINTESSPSSSLHWEIEVSALSSNEQSPNANAATEYSDDALRDTLRRRTLVESTSRAENDRQPRRLLLSRLPVQIQQETNPDNTAGTDLNAIAIRTRAAVEQRERERTASINDVISHGSSDSSPSNQQTTSVATSCETQAYTENKQASPSADNGTAKQDAEVSQRSENKVSSSNIKLKFLDDTQIIAPTSLETTVGQFKRRYFWDSILAGKVVRLIFRGQLLRDESRSLSSYGLHDECVLHCHVSSTPYAPASSAAVPPHSQANMNLGSNAMQSAAAAAIAAIAGTQSVPVSAAGQFARRIPQTYHGRSIEDNPNDSVLRRSRNMILRGLRAAYNVVMGPDPDAQEEEQNAVNAAADAAARGWSIQRQDSPIGMRLGRYMHLLFIVKFILLWTFVFLYPQYTDRFSLLLLTFLSVFFATLLFANRHTNNAQAPVPVS